MNGSNQSNDKTVPSILVIIVTSFAILYQTGTLSSRGGGGFGNANNNNTATNVSVGRRRSLYRRDSSESIGSEGTESSSSSSSRSSFRVRASSKTKCGLWHPSVGLPKTCTNDLNYPQTWNALSRQDKSRIFYTSPTDCCMDHFNETVNCRIVDYCSNDTDNNNSKNSREIPAAILPKRRQRQLVESEPSASPSNNCSQWRPSDQEPGSCTNRRTDGWPSSMFRESHVDCCNDFFHSLSCPIVDVCLDGENTHQQHQQQRHEVVMDTFRML